MWVYTGYEFPTDIITNYHRPFSRQYTIVLYNPGGQESEISISELKTKVSAGLYLNCESHLATWESVGRIHFLAYAVCSTGFFLSLQSQQ